MNLREYESFIFTERNCEFVCGLFELTFDICVCGFVIFLMYFFLLFTFFMIKCSFDDWKQRKLDEREREIFNLSEIEEICKKVGE